MHACNKRTVVNTRLIYIEENKKIENKYCLKIKDIKTRNIRYD